MSIADIAKRKEGRVVRINSDVTVGLIDWECQFGKKHHRNGQKQSHHPHQPELEQKREVER